jgi:hypothetical protein
VSNILVLVFALLEFDHFESQVGHLRAREDGKKKKCYKSGKIKDEGGIESSLEPF